MSTPPALVGRWNIESMDLWVADAIHFVEQGHVTFGERGDERGFVTLRAGAS